MTAGFQNSLEDAAKGGFVILKSAYLADNALKPVQGAIIFSVSISMGLFPDFRMNVTTHFPRCSDLETD
jgi:hypothetical protein